MRLFNLLALIVAMVAFVGAAAPAMAQAGIVGTPVPVCVLRAQPGMTARALLRGDSRFDCTTDQRRFGAGDYWAISAPLRWPGEARLRTASLWDGRSTLYARYADDHIVRATIDQRGASRRMQLGAMIEQPLPTRPVPLVRLLWHVQGAANLRGIVREARLATPDESVRSNLVMGAVYAAFGGLCIALLCYNFALWVALRHRFQLAYCAMVLALLLYALSSSGAVGRLVTLSCAAMAAAAIGFALFAPYDIWLFDRVYSLAFVGQLAVIVPLLWRAWAMRSNYLWMFALAWAAPLAMACFRIASSLGMIHWSFWIDNSTILTMTIEALLSSLAIAYRMRLLSRERDEAREHEIAARLLADTDPLTGLLNRRAFLNRAIGREGTHVLLIADLDHFKAVNETIGHDGGDEVLRVFARTLRQSVPPEALVARIGGEEFAIVTPSAFAVEPAEILARLRAGRMPYDLTVTASIGTCSGPLLRETDWKSLYACADRALFEAKTAGRDRARERTLPERLAA